MATLKIEALGLEEVGPQNIKLDLTSDAALKKAFKTNADKLDYIVKGAEGLDPLVIGLLANYSVSFDEIKDLGEAVAEYGEDMVSAAIAYAFEDKGVPGVLETLNKTVVKGPFNSVSEFAAAELADFNFTDSQLAANFDFVAFGEDILLDKDHYRREDGKIVVFSPTTLE